MQMQQANLAFEKIMVSMNGFTESQVIKNVFGQTQKTLKNYVLIQRQYLNKT